MKRNVYNKTFGFGMVVIAFLNCGFTWGFGTKDQCGEARIIAEALSPEISAAERVQAENTILKLCQDGGAADYLKGLSLEAGKNEAGAIEAYRSASRKEPLLAAAKGRLGLLLLQQGAAARGLGCAV